MSKPYALTGTTGQTIDVAQLFGWAIEESSGSAAAKVRLRAGTLAGTILASVPLAAGAASDVRSADALEVPSGVVYVEVVSGAVAGSIHAR